MNRLKFLILILFLILKTSYLDALGMMSICQKFVWDESSETFQTCNIYTLGYVEDITADLDTVLNRGASGEEEPGGAVLDYTYWDGSEWKNLINPATGETRLRYSGIEKKTEATVKRYDNIYYTNSDTNGYDYPASFEQVIEIELADGWKITVTQDYDDWGYEAKMTAPSGASSWLYGDPHLSQAEGTQEQELAAVGEYVFYLGADDTADYVLTFSCMKLNEGYSLVTDFTLTGPNDYTFTIGRNGEVKGSGGTGGGEHTFFEASTVNYLIAPTDGTTLSTNSFEIRIEADGPLTSATLHLNEVDYPMVGSARDWSITLSNLASGTYTYYVTGEGSSIDSAERTVTLSGNNLSGDWSKEDGIRVENGVSSNTIQLSDGSYRMYYTGEGIKSATSPDGFSWTEEATCISSGGEGTQEEMVANSCVIELLDGTYRMIYEGQENPNTENSVRRFFAAVSSDGINWTKEEGIRYESEDKFVSVPDIIRLSDNSLRMYYTGGATGDRILSALSADEGLTWSQEEGERLSPEGENESVVDPDVILLADGSYYWMFYVCSKFEDDILVEQTIRSATSSDGINWTKEEGVRIAPGDSYDSALAVDPDIVLLSDGSYRMYYGGSNSEEGDFNILSAVSPTTTTTSTESDDSRCFIATAAFGTPMAEEVKSLYKFRDNVLMKTTAGRKLVEIYYKTSPPIANFIKNKPILKAIVREALKSLGVAKE